MPVDIAEMAKEAESNFAHLWIAEMLFAFNRETVEQLLNQDLPINTDHLAKINVACMRCGMIFKPAMAKQMCRGKMSPPPAAYGPKRK